MKISDLINRDSSTGFSFEVLPPLKGKGIEGLFRNIDTLKEFDPLYINITTHRSELMYLSENDGRYRRVSMRSRPGTVAVAAAIRQKYGIPTVPHLIGSGFNRKETEYALIDLNFLGITNVLTLRGDKAKHEAKYIPEPDGYDHAIDLARQVNRFNLGYFSDESRMEQPPVNKFSFGVAGYPEKHEEAPNRELDLLFLKQKVDEGADYVVTQMFFDNRKYFRFVEECRRIGITVPIIPALKPITKLGQLTVLPKVFHVDLPSELAKALMQCQSDDEAKEVGVEWCIAQARELIEHNIPSIHFYSLNAVKSVYRVAKAIY